jgi:hypothetical protein
MDSSSRDTVVSRDDDDNSEHVIKPGIKPPVTTRAGRTVKPNRKYLD